MTPCSICGGRHDQASWPANCWAAPERVRSRLACPTVIADGLPIATTAGTFASRREFRSYCERENVRPLDDGERTGPPPIHKTTDAQLAPILKRHGVI